MDNNWEDIFCDLMELPIAERVCALNTMDEVPDEDKASFFKC